MKEGGGGRVVFQIQGNHMREGGRRLTCVLEVGL